MENGTKIASEIKSMVIDLIAKMNAARARGIVTQFALGNDQAGDYVLAKFEALHVMNHNAIMFHIETEIRNLQEAKTAGGGCDGDNR